MDIKKIVDDVFLQAEKGVVNLKTQNQEQWKFYTRFYYKIEDKTNLKLNNKYPIVYIPNYNVFLKEIQKYNPEMEVIQIACPEWVRIVEDNTLNQPQSIIQVKNKLDEMLEFKPEKIILGCTHYPYLIDILSKFAPKEIFIDPSIYFAEFIKDDLIKNNLAEKSDGTEEIYVSSNPEAFRISAEMFYKIKNSPVLKTFD